ncbi:MAG: c-type cytochrome [Caldilineaceae bacterium]
MGERRSTLEALGALLGLVLALVVLYWAVGYFRSGTTEYDVLAKEAGRPVTLAESLGGPEGIAAGATVSGTETVSGTQVMTESVAVTTTATVTTTAAVTTTGEVTTTAALSETASISATAPVTDNVALESTTPVTVTEPVSVTGEVTTTTEITATSVVTPSAVSASTAVTTTGAVTTTTAVTATTTATQTSAAEPVGASAEAPADVAAIFTKAGCIGCHVIPGVPNAVGVVGPNLSNIGVDGATRIEGLTSAEYIRQSILEPNAFIAPECPSGPCLPNLMVQNLGEILTPEEIDAVVAYLSTLGTGQ